MKSNHNWTSNKLQEFASFEGGGTPSRKKTEYFEKGTIPWVKTLDLNNAIISRTEECITELGLKKSSCKMLPKGSVLIAMYGGFNQIGRTGLLSMEATVNQAITAIILDRNKLLPRYLLFYLNFNVQKWKKFAVSSRKDPNITKEDIKKMLISFPSSIQEQQKIVEVLETWDKAIQLTRKLIEQKELQKKYLMQQLLSHKYIQNSDRKASFYRINEFLNEENNKTTLNNQYPVLSVTKKGVCLQSEYFDKQIASEDNIGYKILTKKKIVFSPMNLWMGAIGFSEQQTGIVSPAYKIFSVNERIALFDFLKYYMKTPRMLYLYSINSEIGASIVRRNLDLNGLLHSKILLPHIEKQKKFSDILLLADKEIDLLRQKLTKLEEQKKGLMQVLLIGKVRLAVRETK